MVKLLGIDPGLRFTGWGIIAADGNRLRHIADGVIATDSDTSVPERLKILHDALSALLAEHRPDEAAVEETYVNRNGAATLKLGYARGVALLAPALMGIKVVEYGAKAVKSAVVGTGRRAGRGHLPRASSRIEVRLGGGHEDGMIAQLIGRVDAIGEGSCIIDVNGVGYLVHASTRTLSALPQAPATAAHS